MLHQVLAFCGGQDETMAGPFETFIAKIVVLDTGGPVVYIGTLIEVNDAGFMLESADVHDERSGHATVESYLNDVSVQGIAVNRKKVLVMRSKVMSVSRLEDVVTE